ncbi:MAG: glycosyltransferase [Acidobacteriia bacterium]|nr:glycosyltransferase [Terriglobia bacterium]
MTPLEAVYGVAGLGGFLATLPGTVELAITTSGAIFKGRPAERKNPAAFRLAVVIPAHNEQGSIKRSIRSVQAAIKPGVTAEIVVIADNCDDQTAERATTAGARVTVRNDPAKRGKGQALHFAFEQLLAEGVDGFLVIDADSVVSANLLEEVHERLGKGAAAVQCRYKVLNPASPRTQLMDVAFSAFNVLRPRGRDGWGLSAGLLGNGFGLSRETVATVPYSAGSIVEDLEYHLLLVSASKHVAFIDNATVYGEMPADEHAARTQRARWEGGRLQIARRWAPRLLQGLIGGRGRMFEPLMDMLSLPLAYQVMVLITLLCAFRGWMQIYAIIGLAFVLGHVATSIVLGGRQRAAVMALMTVPIYILWKLTTLRSVLEASGRQAFWVRTRRRNEL